MEILSRRLIFLVFVGSVLIFLATLIISIPSREEKLYSEFLSLLREESEEKMISFLIRVSNESEGKYYFLRGIKKFYDGDGEGGSKDLIKAVSSYNLSEKEAGLSKLLVGQYLLLEKKNERGIEFLRSKEVYNKFSDYANYILGLFSFEKGNYDEALKLFASITNTVREEIKREALRRILFIKLLREGKAEENVRKQLSEIDRTFYESLLRN